MVGYCGWDSVINSVLKRTVNLSIQSKMSLLHVAGSFTFVCIISSSVLLLLLLILLLLFLLFILFLLPVSPPPPPPPSYLLFLFLFKFCGCSDTSLKLVIVLAKIKSTWVYLSHTLLVTMLYEAASWFQDQQKLSFGACPNTHENWITGLIEQISYLKPCMLFEVELCPWN